MSSTKRNSEQRISTRAMRLERRAGTYQQSLWHGFGSLLALLAITTSSDGARGEIIDIRWDKEGRFEQRLPVMPGKFTEVCGSLDQGQLVAWEFRADRPLNFNVHYHEGKDVVYPVKQDAVQQLTGKLSARVQNVYCWMWSNKTDAEAQLIVTVTR